ncbi:MAG TPA: site-specific DNA-methyltransferase [Acidimicrobiia bacterium]|nr:site-specific DNA-methyltransferase [Acidimicrobiia bacterium]
MGTSTSSFGVGKREGHDSSAFYSRRLNAVTADTESKAVESDVVDAIFCRSAEAMTELASNSVALMVTSPPYHVGKDYDTDASFDDYMSMLSRVFAEVLRVLEPGGRAVVNVANLGRRPYLPLSHLVTQRMLDLGFLMRAEIIWQKARGANGSCAWGSWRSASNPVVRDVHEYCLVFSKGDFRRTRSGISTIGADDFLSSTLSVWEMQPESARRVGHPAPFPVELPRRFIELYTYQGDLVLDPFLGSGTTAVAAKLAGRHFVGYEIDPGYVEMAKQRIEAAT